MKHASTRAVFDHWNERRGAHAAPARNEIDPVAISRALGDTFMLSTDFVDQLRFRLAGTRVCSLFCREIKGEILSELWCEKNRQTIDDVLAIVTGEKAGVVTGLSGLADDGAIADLEMLLLPLARVGRARTGVLGVLAPATATYWFGVKPIVSIEVKTLRHLNSEAGIVTAPHFAAPVEGSQLRHGFTVYTGGRSDEPAERSA
jgi:hypothetical protein